MSHNHENTNALIITIQENQSAFYEYSVTKEGSKLLHNKTVDNDMTTSHEEAKNSWNEFPTGRGKIVAGNEGQWKGDVHKHILKETFIVLTELYKKASIKKIKHILIFFSSNTSKKDLEDQIETFHHNHGDMIIEIENKNVHDHKPILEATDKHYSKNK
jgi:hypothetical protein